MSKLPKRLHRPEWHGAQFALTVADANSNEWLLYCGRDNVVYPGFDLGRNRTIDLTPERHKAIEKLLVEALNYWRTECALKAGNVVPLKPLGPEEN